LTHIRAKRQGGKCLRKRRITRKRVRVKRAQIAEEMRRRLYWHSAETGTSSNRDNDWKASWRDTLPPTPCR